MKIFVPDFFFLKKISLPRFCTKKYLPTISMEKIFPPKKSKKIPENSS